MPLGAGFCSNCGTQLGDSSFSSDPPDPEKPLAPVDNPGSGHFDALAETFNPTGAADVAGEPIAAAVDEG